MDPEYVDRYLRLVASDPQVLRSRFRTLGRRLQPRPDSDVVDVLVAFE